MSSLDMRSWKDGPHTPTAVGLGQAANDPAGSLGCFIPGTPQGPTRPVRAMLLIQLQSLFGHCLSYCSVAVNRQDQSNS